MRQLFSIFLILLSLFSCDSIETNATYDIICNVENETIKETVLEDTTIIEKEYITELSSEVVGYAFYADTTDYLPASYAQALEGKVADRSGENPINAIKEASFDPATGLIQFADLTENRICLFVLCDTKNKIYAYRPFEVGQGSYNVSTYITFQPYEYNDDATTQVVMNRWVLKK